MFSSANRGLFVVGFALLFGKAAVLTAAGIDAPEGRLIEAESSPASDSTVIDDAAASGGKAVSNQKEWRLLSTIPVPAAGDRFTVHIRHKGGPIQLKANIGDKQVERKWVWAKPGAWTWSNAGTYKREDLGQSFVLMRGKDAGAVELDAVVLAAVKAAEGPALPEGVDTAQQGNVLPPAEPDPTKPAVPVAVSVDWSKRVGEIKPMMWGVADYEIHSPTAAADPGYVAFMQKLDPPLIRVHRADFPKQWLTEDEKSWDLKKIRACVDAARAAYGDSPVMLNIAAWPKWMSDEQGILKPEHEDDYIKLCVDLMRICRDEVKFPVAYWEVFNEHDGGPMKKGRLDDVLRQYIKVVNAMRAFDPDARIGGFAFTWANPQWVKPFIDSGALAVSDFVTYHNYGIGAITDSNEKLFSTLDAFERNARYIRGAIDEASGGRHVPILLDEYNVKWVWSPIEPRHANAVGAAFQAAVIRRITLAGIDGATVWHVKGNAYGIIDSSNNERLTAPLFDWGPDLLVGGVFDATSSELPKLEVLAVENGGRRSVLLINKADHAVELPAASSLIGRPGGAVLHRVHSGGVVRDQPVATDQPLSLPGYSFTILFTADASPRDTGPAGAK